jgi:hypothetical protein
MKFNLVPIREPSYNPRRRSGMDFWYPSNISFHQSKSISENMSAETKGGSIGHWNISHYHNFSRLMINNPQCPSPCPSDYPFNSTSSSLSESSLSHQDDMSIITGKVVVVQCISVREIE